MPAMRYTMTGVLGLALTIPLTWGWYLLTMAFTRPPRWTNALSKRCSWPTRLVASKIFIHVIWKEKKDERFVQVDFLLWKIYNRNSMMNRLADLAWLPLKTRNCHIKQLYQQSRYRRLLCWQPLLPAVTTTLSIWQLSVFSWICYRQLHAFAGNKCMSRVNIKDEKLTTITQYTIL